MKVITVSGYAQHGKDSTADIIKKYLEQYNKKVLILHYSDYLKFICEKYFGWNGKKDDAGRTLLQNIGTNVVRTKNPNFWVNIIIEFMQMFYEQYDYFIIPDTRFPGEIKELIKSGFDVITIKVNRIEFDNGLSEEQKNHPSEISLDGYKFDFEINSKSGLHNLEKEIVKIESFL